MSVANSDAVINISADLQDPPELIEEIIKKYNQGNKIVICARQKREDGFAQRITSVVGYFFLALGTQAIPKGGFDYFLMDRETVKYLLALKGRFRFIQGDILSLGFNPYILNYTRNKRIYGKSSYSFSRRLQVFVDSFIDISFIPIKTTTRIGFFAALLGFFLAFLSLISFINGSTPFSGFTAIFVTILIFGGFQLMAMGLIGEYIFRIYDMNRERPVFIIKNNKEIQN
jgi:dolichol-phosphate mannosyltransferase